MRKKLFLIILILFISIVAVSCQPNIIDLNDDPMPAELGNTTWIKADYNVHYGDLCIRKDYRIFHQDNSIFISRTEYNFNNAAYEDVVVENVYKVTFNLDTGEAPKRMKAVLDYSTMNGNDVTGQEDVPIGAPNYTRDFHDIGDKIYYVFSIDYSDNDLDSLILVSGSNNLYPTYIAVNEECYTKVYNDSITTEPADIYAVWKKASFRDRIKDTVFDEAFVEIKQRQLVDSIIDTMNVRITYIFENFPTEVYDYTFTVIFSDIFNLNSGTANLLTVTKNGTDVTGDSENILADKLFPIPSAGQTINFIIEHHGDVIKYTDAEGDVPPPAFDGTMYSLSDDLN